VQNALAYRRRSHQRRAYACGAGAYFSAYAAGALGVAALVFGGSALLPLIALLAAVVLTLAAVGFAVTSPQPTMRPPLPAV
jgi:hypothetical protein